MINQGPCEICKNPINRNYMTAKYCLRCAQNTCSAASQKMHSRRGHLYVCKFANGIIKVGQSSCVESRIKQLRYDLLVFGMTPIKVKTFPCAGNLYQREQMMLDSLPGAPTKRIKREWFKRTSFSKCVGIAEAASGVDLQWFEDITRQAVSRWGVNVPEQQVVKLRELHPQWFPKPAQRKAPQASGAKEESCPA